MRYKIAMLICLVGVLTSNVFAEVDMTIYQRAAEMIDNNWENNYIDHIKFTIGSNTMVVDGEEKQLDRDNASVVPTIIDGKCMLPIRTITEVLDVDIDYSDTFQTVKFELDDIDIGMEIGKKTIKVSGEEKEIAVAPIIENGRTLLPVRDLADNLGLGIGWNAEEQEIKITNDLQLKRIMVQATKEMDFSEFEPIDTLHIGDYFYLIQFDTIGKTKRAYEELQNMDGIESVQLDKIVSLQSSSLAEPASYSHYTWGAKRMNVDMYVDYLNNNNKKDEVVVAVLDTGIDLGHILFYDRIKPGGINVISTNEKVLTDINGHGTHVAGTIADLTKGTNVKILPIKIAAKDFSSYAAMNVAFDYAIKMKVDVVNLSYGHDGLSTNIIKKLVNNNILPVFAAGNDNKNIDSSIKGRDSIVEVGAIEIDDRKASFSNYGSSLDIVAPGDGINSANIGGGYTIKSGTSMATPHISAVAALYKVNNKNLTSSQLEKILKENVDDLGSSGKDIYYGVGVPNMAKAIGSGGTPINKCKTCGSTIESIWRDDGKGNHFRKCEKGHKEIEGMHYDANEDLKCDVCKLDITTCYVCVGKLKNGWLVNNLDQHYKECVNGHPSYIKKHVDNNGDGVCEICGTRKNICTVCKGEVKKDNWLVNVDKGIHYLLCVNGHSNNEAAHIDKNEDTICEICWNNVTTCYVCSGRLKEGWVIDNVGQHYKECVNGHPSYIKKHVDNNGDGVCEICSMKKDVCTVCKGDIRKDNWLVDVDKGIHYLLCVNGHSNNEAAHIDKNEDTICEICWNNVTTCYVCAGRLKEGWVIDNVGQHYKECVNGHPSYIKKHVDGNGDGVCEICGIKNDVCTVCKGEVKKDKWLINLDKGIHYLLCVNGHSNNEAIHIDKNEDTICEICWNNVTTCYVCAGRLKEGWIIDNVGQHYKECVNGHPSYIKKHNIVGEKCNICGFENNKPIEKNIFTDLPNDHWAYNEVKAMVDTGIVNGRGDGTLGTNDSITAEEFMVLLSRVIEKKGIAKANGTVYLQDEITGWSKNGYISLLQAIGVKTGENHDNMGRKEVQIILGNTDAQVISNYKLPITREKVANLMGIFVQDGVENPNNILKAKDWSNVNSVYRSRINELAEKNIFRGSSEIDGIYVKPEDNIIRVETIALINRLYNSI